MQFQAQVNIISQRGVEFSVRIIIVDENNQKITKNVEILAAGIYYSNPDIAGRFIIKGKVDDQIKVSHPDFETIYYTLTSSEDIKIVVDNYVSSNTSKSKFVSKSKRVDFHEQNIDSAIFYKKKNIEKSLSFIEKALQSNQNRKRKSFTYKLLHLT